MRCRLVRTEIRLADCDRANFGFIYWLVGSSCCADAFGAGHVTHYVDMIFIFFWARMLNERQIERDRGVMGETEPGERADEMGQGREVSLRADVPVDA